ncbi:hypothetical protein GCM10009759_58610 [Kitasatospora saccharophila]|uniref:Uncharacterized protein n=1 Tax=Kitasatospora saccharophila TaxID=407973 RepID=A0ABP5J9Y5_9ACTN
MTDIQIRLSGADPIGETAALWEWLRGEPQLRGLVRAVPAPPAEGELGGAVDLLQVAAGASGVAGVLARSLTVWLRTRRSHLRVTVTRADGGGTTTVEVSNLDPGQVEGVLRRTLDGSGDGSGDENKDGDEHRAGGGGGGGERA